MRDPAEAGQLKIKNYFFPHYFIFFTFCILHFAFAQAPRARSRDEFPEFQDPGG